MENDETHKIDEFVILIGEIEDVIREQYRKEFNLKTRDTFNSSPILREKILEFIKKCYNKEVFFYEIIKKDDETIHCRKCREGELDSENYCVICNEVIEPISEEYGRRGRLAGEGIIAAGGGDFDRYTTELTKQFTDMQSKIALKLNRIGIEIEPKDVPPGIKTKKEAVEWIKRKYSRIILLDNKLEAFMNEFKLGSMFIKMKKELEEIIKSDPKTYSEVAYEILSKEIKSSMDKAGVRENLYKKITLKLREEGIIEKGQIPDDINLAILDWALNDISKSNILSKYNLTPKNKQKAFDDMVEKWARLGIITLPQRGYGGPKLTLEYSNLDR